MDYENLSDEKLVELSNKGDIESMNKLLYRYKTTVKSIARKFFLIGGETDDLIQEGMVALYYAIHEFKPNKNATFKTFASLCIKRQIYDTIKTYSRDKNKPLNDFVSLYAPQIENNLVSETNPEIAYLAEESFLAIEKKIEKVLDDEERKIFKLYFDGLSYKEIADNLNITVKRVDNKLQKIKKTLKTSLK